VYQSAAIVEFEKVNFYSALPVSSACVFLCFSVEVCSLAAGLKENTVLSSSWDETACVWKLDGAADPLITLSGHKSAVWSVIQLTSGDIITGSADKTIKVWNRDGLIQHTLTGLMCIMFLLIRSEQYKQTAGGPVKHC
jgi:WD40 repeat protein